jgi:CRP/FNR family transcriptional regulator, cyclic AMP receptor protein
MPSIPKEREFRPSQFIFREGEPSNSLYLVKKGVVAIRKLKGHHYVELGKIFPNEVLGELSFFDRKARSAAAVAITEVEVLEFSFESLDAVYRDVPDYMRTIMASVAERLRKANETIRKLQRNVVDERGREEMLTLAQMAEAESTEIDLGKETDPTPKPSTE